jgi:hypothetical protein
MLSEHSCKPRSLRQPKNRGRRRLVQDPRDASPSPRTGRGGRQQVANSRHPPKIHQKGSWASKTFTTLTRTKILKRALGQGEVRSPPPSLFSFHGVCNGEGGGRGGALPWSPWLGRRHPSRRRHLPGSKQNERKQRATENNKKPNATVQVPLCPIYLRQESFGIDPISQKVKVQVVNIQTYCIGIQTQSESIINFPVHASLPQ